MATPVHVVLWMCICIKFINFIHKGLSIHFDPLSLLIYKMNRIDDQELTNICKLLIRTNEEEEKKLKKYSLKEISC